MNQFNLVSALSPQELVVLINDYLARGWKLSGQMIIDHRPLENGGIMKTYMHGMTFQSEPKQQVSKK